MTRDIRGCMADVVHSRREGVIIAFGYNNYDRYYYYTIKFDDGMIERLPRGAFYFNKEEKAFCWDQ